MVGEEYGKVQAWGAHPKSMVGFPVDPSTGEINEAD